MTDSCCDLFKQVKCLSCGKEFNLEDLLKKARIEENERYRDLWQDCNDYELGAFPCEVVAEARIKELEATDDRTE